MSITYKCYPCKYSTTVHCNYKKHILSKIHLKIDEIYNTQNINNEKKKKDNIGGGYEVDTIDKICIIKPHQISCNFCKKIISKSNLTKHHKICKSNISNTLNTKQVNDDELVDCMKIIAKYIGNSTDNVNNYNTRNVYCITNPVDYFNKLVENSITNEESIDEIDNSGYIDIINHLLEHCIVNINFKNELYHLNYDSMGKYHVGSDNFSTCLTNYMVLY
jgi:hypothetical protein